MLVLYYAPDTCALASHVALEEARADFSLRGPISKRASSEVPSTSPSIQLAGFRLL